jgi:hypothetical protein
VNFNLVWVLQTPKTRKNDRIVAPDLDCISFALYLDDLNSVGEILFGSFKNPKQDKMTVQLPPIETTYQIDYLVVIQSPMIKNKMNVR